MSFVILNQMYFPIILSLSSDDQQFHQYQENEQSHFLCYFRFNFFLYKNIVNMSVSNRLYYYNWVDTCPGGVIPPEGINHPVVSSSTLTRFALDIFMLEIDSS
jgi:hypothetical protein